MRISCAEIKRQECDERGDVSMAAMFVRYLSDEERTAAVEKGIEQGIEQGIEKGIEKGIERGADLMLKLILEGVNPKEAAQKVKESLTTL